MSTESVSFAVVDAFFKSFNMNESKQQSFDKLYAEGFPNILRNEFPFVSKFENEYELYELMAVTANKPVSHETDQSTRKLEPKEARLRQKTYESEYFLHLRVRMFRMPTNEVVAMEKVMQIGELVSDEFKQYVPGPKLPISLRSQACYWREGRKNYGECLYDNGGYFLVDGAEKMLMYRERMAFNRIYLHPRKDGPSAHVAEFRSEYYGQFRSSENVVVELYKATKTEPASLFIKGIPWVTFIRALGVVKAKDIYSIFRFVAKDRWNTNYKNLFKNSMKNDQGIVTRQAALARIGSLAAPAEKNITVLEDLGLRYIRNKFFPSMKNMERDDINKLTTLCEMACRVFDYSVDASLKTNKDSGLWKCEETCEDLMGNLGRQHIVNWISTIKMLILKKRRDKKKVDIYELFADDKCGKGLRDALASGMWHANKHNVTQTGVSQKVEKTSFTCAQAQQMKVINQLRKEVKQIAPRLLAASSYGITCPADSPGGATCGLVKHNAILQHISSGTDGAAITHLLLNVLKVVSLEKLTVQNMRDAVKANAQYVFVTVNGTPIGVYDDPVKVFNFVRDCKLRLSISADTGVSFTKSRVEIRTDRGRNMRPLFVSEKLGRLNPKNDIDGLNLNNLSWTYLLSEGIVEYVDKEEEQNLLIAIDVETYNKLNSKKVYKPSSSCREECITSKEMEDQEFEYAYDPDVFLNIYNVETLDPQYYTHMEIHGSAFWGLSASLIPFPDHNQSPRNTYQCAMGRQAQGIFSSVAKLHRMDTCLMEMWYAQRPLVETQIARILGCQKFPCGQNVNILVMSGGQMAQEDATMQNQAAIEFGMLRSSIYRTTVITENKQNKLEGSEEIRKMDLSKVVSRKKGDPTHIEEDGIIAVGAPVQNATVLAQKGMRVKENFMSKDSALEMKDMSVMSLSNEHGIVDRVLVQSTACGIKTIKIRTIKTAITVIGDKFCTRYGQKGVNGHSIRAVDMPFTENGVIPHVIINSLAFSSRMTWGEWLETLYATVCIMNGQFGDATSFSRQYRDALYIKMEHRRANFRPGHIVDEICDALKFLGMNSNGEHVMYSGTTGEQFKARLFMGLTYFQKLKHMVKDKIRARGRGRMQALVRCAVEGRVLNGGLKFGEMERDCLSAHGCAFNIQDRMCYSSDPIYMHVCTECKNSVIYNEESDKIWCQICNKYDTAVCVLMPYSFKLFQQEAIASNINIKIEVEKVQ